MAAYVSVPRDLTTVKSKVFFNLTKRQLICFGAAVVIGVPTFFALKSVTNSSVAVLGMIVVMMPLFVFAMYEKNGMPLEVILGHYINFKFIRPQVRPYKTDNYYSALVRQDKVNKEVDAIVKRKEKDENDGGNEVREDNGTEDNEVSEIDEDGREEL